MESQANKRLEVALSAAPHINTRVTPKRWLKAPLPAALPQPTPQQRKLMGLDSPLDQKISVTVRDWNVIKIALWRNRVAWEIVTRSAEEMVESCAHMEGCPGKSSETSPCLRDCPDREMRMSVLVILNAARPFGQFIVNKPADAPYYAPSREYYSSLLAELMVARAELEALRGKQMTEPPPELEFVSADSEKTPPQLKEAT